MIINYLIRNQVFPLAIHNLKRWGIIGSLSGEMQVRIAKYDYANLYSYNKNTNELFYIIKNIKQTSYRVLFLKGTVLNIILYNNHPGVRNSTDIDLLAAASDSENLFNYMIDKMGYRCLVPDEDKKIYPILLQHFAPLVGKNKVCVEIHHRFTQEGDGYELNYDRIFKNCNYIVIPDKELEVPIPSIEDILINLCYHQYQHEFRETHFLLKAHSDIFNLIYNLVPRIDWRKFIKDVIADRIQFPIMYSLYFTNQVFYHFLNSCIIPQFVLDAIIPKDFEKEKDAIISRCLFDNDAFGYWRHTYIDRLFLDPTDRFHLLCKEYFINRSNNKLKDISEKYGFDYNKLKVFIMK
jgi:hypothetical protein